MIGEHQIHHWKKEIHCKIVGMPSLWAWSLALHLGEGGHVKSVHVMPEMSHFMEGPMTNTHALIKKACARRAGAWVPYDCFFSDHGVLPTIPYSETLDFLALGTSEMIPSPLSHPSTHLNATVRPLFISKPGRIIYEAVEKKCGFLPPDDVDDGDIGN